MSDLILTTFDWVPEMPRSLSVTYVRVGAGSRAALPG